MNMNITLARYITIRKSATLNTLTRDDGPIEGCRKTLNQLDGLFSSDYLHQTSGNRSKRRKVKATLTTLAWPFKENTARKLLVEVVQHKTTLNLALTVDMWCEIKRAIGTSRTMVSDTNIGCSHDIKIIKSQASEIQATLTGMTAFRHICLPSPWFLANNSPHSRVSTPRGLQVAW